MSIKPIFSSAPRMILTIKGSDGLYYRVGYAIGLSVNVAVNVVPVYTLGSFSPASLEVVNYQPVTGTFQIVKLQKKADRTNRIKLAKDYYKDSGIVKNPNGITSSVEDNAFAMDENGKTAQDNNPLKQARLFTHLDPLQALVSETFDIKMFLNLTPAGDQNYSQYANPDKLSAAEKEFKVVHFMTIQDCRLTSRSINISANTLLNEPLSFTGLLAINGSNEERLDTMVNEG